MTAEKNRWLLETFLFPEIGSRSIGEITPRELLDALRSEVASGDARWWTEPVLGMGRLA